MRTTNSRLMLDVDGFILTGGASSRMGTDKARLRLGGKTFVERAEEALRAITTRVCLVSARMDGASSGLPVIKDIYLDRGALGGLHATLKHGASQWVAVVPCDLPFVTGSLLKRLASFASEQFHAIAPMQADGRPQPLCALYRRDECLPVVEQLIRDGELRPRVLLERVRTCRVSFDELTDLDGASLFFTNINTPEDYDYACRRESEGAVIASS